MGFEKDIKNSLNIILGKLSLEVYFISTFILFDLTIFILNL